MISTIMPESNSIVNMGTGAGGQQTNANGKNWEQQTTNVPYLLKNGFITINSNCLIKKCNDSHDTIYLAQGGLRDYFMTNHNIYVHRNPDEAYLIKKMMGHTY